MFVPESEALKRRNIVFVDAFYHYIMNHHTRVDTGAFHSSIKLIILNCTDEYFHLKLTSGALDSTL